MRLFIFKPIILVQFVQFYLVVHSEKINITPFLRFLCHFAVCRFGIKGWKNVECLNRYIINTMPMEIALYGIYTLVF